jgi:hypothetical protein
MKSIVAVLAVLAAVFVASSIAQQSLPPYTLGWFDQTTDHFNFATQPQKWQQRWLYVDQYWNKQQGAPILFYSGNEGDIFMFYNNTGFIFELAQQFGAYVIFAEHRYYGASIVVWRGRWRRETPKKFVRLFGFPLPDAPGC